MLKEEWRQDEGENEIWGINKVNELIKWFGDRGMEEFGLSSSILTVYLYMYLQALLLCFFYFYFLVVLLSCFLAKFAMGSTLATFSKVIVYGIPFSLEKIGFSPCTRDVS